MLNEVPCSELSSPACVGEKEKQTNCIVFLEMGCLCAHLALFQLPDPGNSDMEDRRLGRRHLLLCVLLCKGG